MFLVFILHFSMNLDMRTASYLSRLTEEWEQVLEAPLSESRGTVNVALSTQALSYGLARCQKEI